MAVINTSLGQGLLGPALGVAPEYVGPGGVWVDRNSQWTPNEYSLANIAAQERAQYEAMQQQKALMLGQLMAVVNPPIVPVPAPANMNARNKKLLLLENAL